MMPVRDIQSYSLLVSCKFLIIFSKSTSNFWYGASNFLVKQCLVTFWDNWESTESLSTTETYALFACLGKLKNISDTWITYCINFLFLTLLMST